MGDHGYLSDDGGSTGNADYGDGFELAKGPPGIGLSRIRSDFGRLTLILRLCTTINASERWISKPLGVSRIICVRDDSEFVPVLFGARVYGRPLL